ncbi:type II secretion system F family protein, partial [bacterium]|nr:type II secretion system F family protein [bacterium]
ESKRFKYELISYGSETAFNNLVKRTGSESVGTIVGYMKLSEETGIGVKTIFENLAQEIRAAQTLEVEKRAATMNISLTFTMFIFILPAIIAMIAFAVASGELMKIV